MIADEDTESGKAPGLHPFTLLMLTVRGERPAKERISNDGFEHIERAASSFLRRFTLPESARVEAIKARNADGVLEIPKQPRIEAKRISATVY